MWKAVVFSARLLQFVGATTLFGSPLFYLYGIERQAQPGSALSHWRWARRLLLAAAALTLLGAVLWVMAETVSFSGDSSDALRFAALWTVLADTRFGRACLARMILLGLSITVLLIMSRSRVLWGIQGLIGALVVASFAWTGHGASGQGPRGGIHLSADLLHLWTAGIWLGALVPLALLAKASTGENAPVGARALQYGLTQFSRMGTAVVAVLVLSGLVNAWFLIGPARWRALFDTAYGLALVVKLTLFAGMLALAARHRFELSPALATELRQPRSLTTLLRTLRSSLLTETGLALAVLLAISLMGTWAPPASGE